MTIPVGMIDPKDHPFQPGTEVAIRTGYPPNLSWEVAKVAKVHKTGRFTLQDKPVQKQWRPWAPASGSGGRKIWMASGSGYSTRSVELYLLTTEIKAQIAADQIASSNRIRWNRVCNRVENYRLKNVDPATFSTIVSVLEIAMDELETAEKAASIAASPPAS